MLPGMLARRLEPSHVSRKFSFYLLELKNQWKKGGEWNRGGKTGQGRGITGTRRLQGGSDDTWVANPISFLSLDFD